MGRQWHQLDHIQIICTSLQADNHASTSPLSFYRPHALRAAQPAMSKHWKHLRRRLKHHNRFMALFPGPPGWAGARWELLDFVVRGKINRGRHTDRPAGRHSIRLTSAHIHHPHIFFYGPDALPAAQPTVSKHWRQSIREMIKKWAVVIVLCVRCHRCAWCYVSQ